jgi:hypothetical protein
LALPISVSLGDMVMGALSTRLWSFPNVTRLMLSMYPEASFTKFAMATSRLIGILKSSARLDHLTIRRPWSYSEDELIDLVSSHATNVGGTCAQRTDPI